MTTYWSTSAGDDDPNATRHTDITEAEKVAAERSLTIYHHTCWIRRISGQRIREYRDGVLVGYLAGDQGEGEKWVQA
jgi:hypothetical protein